MARTSKGRKAVSIVSNVIESRLRTAHVRYRNPTGREDVYSVTVDGVPAIELRVTMQGSRGVEGVGVRIGTAGRADEAAPLYKEYPYQGPSLGSVYDMERGWKSPWNEATLAPRIDAAAIQHWGGWLERFRVQWRAHRVFWLDAIQRVCEIDDLRNWVLGNELAHRRLRFSPPEQPPTALTPYGDEYVMAVLGFADFIEQVVGEPLAVSDVEMVRSVGTLCRDAIR